LISAGIAITCTSTQRFLVNEITRNSRT